MIYNYKVTFMLGPVFIRIEMSTDQDDDAVDEAATRLAKVTGMEYLYKELMP